MLVAPLVAQGLNDRIIAERIGETKQGVRAYRRRQGIGSNHRQPTRPIPEGIVLAGRSIADVASDMRCGWPVARRWFDEQGVTPIARQPNTPRYQQRVGPVAQPQTDQTVAILRSHYANVFRCDILLRSGSAETFGTVRGLPDRGSRHWYVEGVGIVDRARLEELTEVVRR